MNKVRDELNRLKAEESARHNASYRMLMAGAAGPDGGMAAMDCYRSQVNYTGKWNTKTVEDYISMVKAELKRQHITVDAVMEKKMVDHLIKERIPSRHGRYGGEPLLCRYCRSVTIARAKEERNVGVYFFSTPPTSFPLVFQ